jgi:DUF4097 and DUF4098 domain-containing protein YvlB
MSRKVFIINVILTVAFIAGGGWISKAKYTKQVNLTIPAGQAESFTAQTHNGNIEIKGSRIADCNLTATITVKADTEENAKKIAEQVKINLVPEANNINVRIEKPDTSNGVQIGVGLDAILPAGMNLSLATHNGNIAITDMSGNAELSTHNGNVEYKGIPANLKISTHNGSVKVNCIQQSEKPCEMSAETHNGNIDFTASANFSAAIDASTHNGLTHTSLPITVIEKTNEKLSGTIGSGRDKLQLKTHNGSINIR